VRRAWTAIGTTIAALVLVLNFELKVAVDASSTAVFDPSVGPTGTPGESTAPDATATPDATTTPGVGAPAVPGTPEATTAPTAGTSTVDGPVEWTEWGPVQVRVVVQDGVLVDVVALQLPSGDRHSDRINARAEPIYRAAALEAQSAAIDHVSGATVTWRGYRASLQAALDQAGVS
jgi:uncharacterized protein with FMN-binding domain